MLVSYILAACVTALTLQQSALEPTPEEIFDFVDKNENGLITKEEAEVFVRNVMIP